MADIRRWQAVEGVTPELFAVLDRWPRMADRAMHEIERLWAPEFSGLTTKRKKQEFERTSWYVNLTPIQRQVCSKLADLYCKQMGKE